MLGWQPLLAPPVPVAQVQVCVCEEQIQIASGYLCFLLMFYHFLSELNVGLVFKDFRYVCLCIGVHIFSGLLCVLMSDPCQMITAPCFCS